MRSNDILIEESNPKFLHAPIYRNKYYPISFEYFVVYVLKFKSDKNQILEKA